MKHIILLMILFPSLVFADISDCGPDPIEDSIKNNMELTSEEWLLYTYCLALKGDSKAQLNMGIAYRDGSDGPAPDFIKAAEWFHESATKGNAYALYNLGVLYHEGKGVEKNPIEAHKWFSLAIQQFQPDDSTRDLANSKINLLEKKLTAEQVTKAQSLASQWLSQYVDRSNQIRNFAVCQIDIKDVRNSSKYTLKHKFYFKENDIAQRKYFQLPGSDNYKCNLAFFGLDNGTSLACEYRDLGQTFFQSDRTLLTDKNPRNNLTFRHKDVFVDIKTTCN